MSLYMFLSDVIYENVKKRKREKELDTDLLHSFIYYTFLYISETIGTFRINADVNISSKLEKALHYYLKNVK